MTSSNGNIFRVTGHLCWEFAGHRSPHKGQWRGALVFSLFCAWINGWVNNREAGDLRRHRAHYDVTVMLQSTHDKRSKGLRYGAAYIESSESEQHVTCTINIDVNWKPLFMPPKQYFIHTFWTIYNVICVDFINTFCTAYDVICVDKVSHVFS